MKNFRIIVLFVLSVLVSVSCDLSLEKSRLSGGRINVSFLRLPPVSKSSLSLPDTNDFILSVRNASGKVFYEGKFGDSPQNLTVPAGTYSVAVSSCEFMEPAFDCPQYGDEQVVAVAEGKTVSVRLECSQLNAGLRLVTDPSFRTMFPSGVLYVRSAAGNLMYGYAESRTAYFKPGPVSVELECDGVSDLLLSRNMQPRQMLTLRLNADTGAGPGGITLQVDTARVWERDDYMYGGAKEGEDVTTAVSVSSAANFIGRENIWIYGYLVGVSVSTSKSEYEAPFSSNTNILLSSRSVVSSRNECLSVELPKGDLRDALNLKDNPDNIGRQIYLKGNLVDSYYGLHGLKSVSEFKWK